MEFRNKKLYNLKFLLDFKDYINNIKLKIKIKK